jgi:chromosome segregation ATPase
VRRTERREWNRQWAALRRLSTQLDGEAKSQRRTRNLLGKLLPEVSAQIAQLETGTHAMQRQLERLEDEIDAHIAAAQTLAQILLRLATKYGDPLLLKPNIAKLVENYLPWPGQPPTAVEARAPWQ